MGEIYCFLPNLFDVICNSRFFSSHSENWELVVELLMLCAAMHLLERKVKRRLFERSTVCVFVVKAEYSFYSLSIHYNIIWSLRLILSLADASRRYVRFEVCVLGICRLERSCITTFSLVKRQIWMLKSVVCFVQW